MSDIVLLTGNVDYTITLDPTVWIFDDRKIELESLFQSSKEEKQDSLMAYTEKMAKNWERELTEEKISPPVNRSIKKFEKEKILAGTFAIPLKPFIENAGPKQEAKEFIVETSDGHTHEIPLHIAEHAFLGFSKDGRPLREDGPIHFYFGDGSNRKNPVRHVIKFIVA
ncbi:peptidyl-prolyl cis-trans isomerase [Bacillus taeanensis]|uniref:Peptidyl-prolyl cis-trans isomerase n=1 Tax=Bacillus taeanensis TaxID=273032 RepID=A0A366XU38_9BACI|nr:peptidyl-prolyl cis-trans isomerase [Bacillus taeanensis]RBW69417.1 peptidyl-prolyl cis-trans isomerase [Bacillus taeanensis]